MFLILTLTVREVALSTLLTYNFLLRKTRRLKSFKARQRIIHTMHAMQKAKPKTESQVLRLV